MKDYSSIVVSSVVSLRRNLFGFDFPSMLDERNGVKVLNKVADNILKLDGSFKIYKIKTLPEIDKNIMFEKGLISKRLLSSEDFGATILSENEEESVMVNEEDHIVETCSMVGLNLIAAYVKLNELDNQILSRLDIAFDNMFGFLTSNIAKAGTGLDAKINLFLPGLFLTGKIRNVQAEINNMNVDINFARDTRYPDCQYCYYISNAQTIGRKESEYVLKLCELAIKICEMEIAARNELLMPLNVDETKDRVFRAWGILTNCYKINENEAQKYLEELKLGVALNFIRFKDAKCIETLFVDVLPYSLTKISDSKVTSVELDKYRATFLSNVLKAKRVK